MKLARAWGRESPCLSSSQAATRAVSLEKLFDAIAADAQVSPESAAEWRQDVPWRLRAVAHALVLVPETDGPL